MKRLLSVVAILVLACALLPVQGQAGYRGAYLPMTYPNPWVNGPEQLAFRPAPVDDGEWVYGTPGQFESWMTVSVRSVANGAVRELWLVSNCIYAPIYGVVLPLLIDPAVHDSYADPAWSPDGRWLAYVKTNASATYAEIWMQEFGMASFRDENYMDAVTPIGDPVRVAAGGIGILNRHPCFSPDGHSIVFDSNKSGTSIDLYTVPVFDMSGNAIADGPATRITFNNTKAEIEPSWSPDGTRIAYVSNEFGAFAPKILDLSTVPNPTDGTIADATLFPTSYHNMNWSWVPGENVVYFQTNAGGDPNSVQRVWRLDLNTQAKCQLQGLDPVNADFWPTVSHVANSTSASGGISFNYYAAITQEQVLGFGNIVYRTNYLQSLCHAPLPMGVAFSPATLNLGSGGPGSKLTVTVTMPAEVQAQGFAAYPTQAPDGREGFRWNTSGFYPSPLVDGTRPLLDPVTGGVDYKANLQQGTLDMYLSRRTIEQKAAALGLVGKLLPLKFTAYSQWSGAHFEGIGYLTVTTSSLAGSAIKMLQNSPNPFNPQTKITFGVNKPGMVEVQVFNVRGELVKTLAKQWYPQGEHTVTWDGRTENGIGAPSGMYFAVAKSNGSTDRMKMMLMK
jgi:hypothetical protein